MRPKELTTNLEQNIRRQAKEIKRKADGIYNAVIDIVDEKDPVKRVVKIEDFHKSILDKGGELYGITPMIEDLEFSADDGELIHLQLHAVMDCGEEKIIDADQYELDRQHPEWIKAIEEIINIDFWEAEKASASVKS